jgi:hypothetical protein
MSEFKRARVAITLPGKPDNCEPEDFSGHVVHIGHARTLLIGKMVADVYECPYHVRIDGAFGVPHVTPSVLDLLGCLSFIGVNPDKVYMVTNRPPSYADAVAAGIRPNETGRKLWATEGLHPTSKCCFLDDYVEWGPSLVVRGAEFNQPEQHLPPIMAFGTRSMLEQEALFREVFNYLHHEFNVPLMTVEGAKMSKTAARAVHWSTLTMVKPETARAFLLATAVKPDDALAMTFMGPGEKFGLGYIKDAPYEWSWATWREVVRRDA